VPEARCRTRPGLDTDHQTGGMSSSSTFTISHRLIPLATAGSGSSRSGAG
jgi:hypothetical protein